MQAKAIVATAEQQVALQTVEVPAPGPGEVLVEAAYTAISPGTELRCLAGKQEGVRFPFVPGYSMVGRIIARGDGVSVPEGTLVYCAGTTKANVSLGWGGHVSHAVMPAANAYPLPDNVHPLDGLTAHLAAIAYRGVRLSKAQPHEHVAVVGLGVIGQLAARLHALTGARVVCADLAPARVEVARQVGLEAFVPQSSLADSFRAVFPQGADVVVDATGVAAVLPQAIGIARDVGWDDTPRVGARYIIQGSYPGDFCIPYQPAFLKEMSFWLPRDVQPADVRVVLNLMARGKLPARDLISEIRSPEEAQRTYDQLRDPACGLLTVAFRWVD
ncbi:MAG: zinc-binding alcohol dehydrogenase [Chloroflexi bacterium]|nr:zinc-binding alcohol dehydrogenase [Chloroflexota bacterium]